MRISPVATTQRDDPFASVQVEDINAKEFAAAERYWIAEAQNSVYGATVNRLLAKQPIATSDPLLALSPELDTVAEPPLIVVDC